MPELRYNMISREWVVIATERARRPKDFKKASQEAKALPGYKKECPFCPGNESESEAETFRMGDEKAWSVRVVPNKFPALSSQEKPTRRIEGDYVSMRGFGIHEVIVEHPRHNAIIPLMTDVEVGDIIRTYRARYISIRKTKGIEAIVIFKNHGPLAGTSLEHPHSQLIATPVVPPQARSRIEQAVGFFDFTGRCIFCHTLEKELREEKRIIVETEKFVSFMPYAALSPFHIWLFPRRHASSFAGITEEEIDDLARNLKTTLAKLYHGLGNPDFNYTIHSIPVNETESEYCHWYISIIPRVSQMAGFELGSGIFINVALPEESAQFLRQVTHP